MVLTGNNQRITEYTGIKYEESTCRSEQLNMTKIFRISTSINCFRWKIVSIIYRMQFWSDYIWVHLYLSVPVISKQNISALQLFMRHKAAQSQHSYENNQYANHHHPRNILSQNRWSIINFILCIALLTRIFSYFDKAINFTASKNVFFFMYVRSCESFIWLCI